MFSLLKSAIAVFVTAFIWETAARQKFESDKKPSTVLKKGKVAVESENLDNVCSIGRL